MSYSPAIGRWMEQDPEEYVNGPNMYQMELSNPPAHTDPTGLDVRIENTHAVGGYHRHVSVDTYDAAGNKNGEYSISFGVDGNQPGSSSNNTNSSGGGSSGASGGGSGSGSGGSAGSGSSTTNGSGGGPTKGGSGSGVVYVDPDPATKIADTLHTTKCEDEAIKKYLESVVDYRGSYSLIFYNCRSFSRQQFEYIKNHLHDFDNGVQPPPSPPRQ